MSEESDLNQNLPPAQALTRLPNGDVVSVFDLVERQRNTEAEIDKNILRDGDLIAMQYQKEDGTTSGIAFEVESVEWSNLGVSSGFSPGTTLTGKLDGAEMPNEVTNNSVTFVGSGWGGSMHQPGLIATGRSPYFVSDKGEFRSPIISNFEIFRKDESGDLRPLEPTQVDAEARKTAQNHHERLGQIEKLMKLFNFDNQEFRDGSKGSRDTLSYEDDRYIANYEASMAMGNKLAVYDKNTGLWVEFKYYNFKNEDVLQVAHADLSKHEKNELFISGRIAEEPSVHISGEAITTFVTSSRYGIEAVNYKPSKQEAIDVLNIPTLLGGNYTPTPNFQIFPTGHITVQETYQSSLEEERPGFIEDLEKGTDAKINEDGTITLSIKGNEILINNPDTELQRIINQVETLSESEVTKSKTVSAKHIGGTVGRFIRRAGSSNQKENQ